MDSLNQAAFLPLSLKLVFEELALEFVGNVSALLQRSAAVLVANLDHQFRHHVFVAREDVFLLLNVLLGFNSKLPPELIKEIVLPRQLLNVFFHFQLLLVLLLSLFHLYEQASLLLLCVQFIYFFLHNLVSLSYRFLDERAFLRESLVVGLEFLDDLRIFDLPLDFILEHVI